MNRQNSGGDRHHPNFADWIFSFMVNKLLCFGHSVIKELVPIVF
ncbi:hypothetical protein [Bacillus salipaludis]|nr:hypothetical protein [Bacillus salipaludis]